MNNPTGQAIAKAIDRDMKAREPYFARCVIDGKNYRAIEKIIAYLTIVEYYRANPLKADGTPTYKKYHPYYLTDEILKACEVKRKYLRNEITEEEYKAYCLKKNLIMIFE